MANLRYYLALGWLSTRKLLDAQEMQDISWKGNSTDGAFLKYGYPYASSILMGFSIINHPAIGLPHLWKAPMDAETSGGLMCTRLEKFPRYCDNVGK